MSYAQWLRSKAVVLLFLIVAPIVGFCNCSRLCCASTAFVSDSVSVSCCVALPRGATGFSAVCDCAISLSYSLTFLIICYQLRRADILALLCLVSVDNSLV